MDAEDQVGRRRPACRVVDGGRITDGCIAQMMMFVNYFGIGCFMMIVMYHFVSAASRNNW